MATVYKRGNVYWCAFFAPGENQSQKRIYKTTKQTSRKEAQDAARRMELEANGALTGPNATKAHAILMEAAEQSAKGLLTEGLVRKHLIKLAEISTGQSMNTQTVEGWFNGWLSDKTRTRSAATAAAYRTTVKGFLASLPAQKRSAPLESLTTDDFSKFRDSRQDGGRAMNTVNNALKVLAVPMKLAFEQGHISNNPVKPVGRLEKQHQELEDQMHSVSTFTPEQVCQLIKAASDTDWNGAIRFGYFTGLRLRDVANLRWKNLNLEKRELILMIRKTKRREIKFLHDDLHAWLMALAVPADPEAFLFPSLVGRSTGGQKGLSLEFSKLMGLAGIKSKVRARSGKAGHSRSELSFHSLRHTFNSSLANAGVDQELRMKLTGHLSQSINDQYTHHDQQSLRTALAKLPGIG